MVRFTVFLPFFLLVFSNASVSASDLPEELKACRVIDDVEQRVTCYDAIVDGDVESQVAEMVDELVEERIEESIEERVEERAEQRAEEIVQARAAGEKPSDFGLPPEPIDKTTKEVTSPVVAVSYSLRDKVTVILENDQVWRQTDSARLRVKAGDTVVVSKGMFGAHFLKKVDENRRIRVKRLE